MKKLIVNEKYDGKKLNKFLLDNIENLSSNLLYKTLRKKDIKFNGKRVSENVLIHLGDEVLVYISDDLLDNLNSINLDIFFEDENILVINKPYNLEVTGNNSLTSIVHKKYENSLFKPMPCHRIDRNTTGLVIFAKNEEALEILLKKFKEHEIEKHYLALVYGIPNKKEKRLEAYLFKDNKKSQVYISDTFKKGYQKIITKYTVLEKRKDNTALLDVEINSIDSIDSINRGKFKSCLKKVKFSDPVSSQEVSELETEILETFNQLKSDIDQQVYTNIGKYSDLIGKDIEKRNRIVKANKK